MDALEPVPLSDHFMAGEFRCHGTTCGCHGAVQVSMDLVNVLEELRCLTGGPVSLTCGFRCDDHNAAVLGHAASFHRVGKAGDVTSFVIRQDLEGWAHKAAEIIRARLPDTGHPRPMGNVIWYKYRGFIHIDVGHQIGETLVRVNESRTPKKKPGGGGRS